MALGIGAILEVQQEVGLARHEEVGLARHEEVGLARHEEVAPARHEEVAPALLPEVLQPADRMLKKRPVWQICLVMQTTSVLAQMTKRKQQTVRRRDRGGEMMTRGWTMIIKRKNKKRKFQETRIEVEIPKINTNFGKQLQFVKLPNFLSVDTRPFDEAVYEDEIDEDEVMDEEGRARLKLKVENTMRWRYAKDEYGNPKYDDLGNQVKESNARMIRWSDGSMSMHLGNEIFDVHSMALQGDYNHLFVRQGLGLQGQAVFKTKLTFRPHSTDSFTHRKMTMSLADRTSKTQKVKVLPIAGKDPESQRTEMIKKEEERLKASIRRESQQRRMKEKAHQRGISSNYLEGDLRRG